MYDVLSAVCNSIVLCNLPFYPVCTTMIVRTLWHQSSRLLDDIKILQCVANCGVTNGIVATLRMSCREGNVQMSYYNPQFDTYVGGNHLAKHCIILYCIILVLWHVMGMAKQLAKAYKYFNFVQMILFSNHIAFRWCFFSWSTPIVHKAYAMEHNEKIYDTSYSFSNMHTAYIDPIRLDLQVNSLIVSFIRVESI